MPLIIAVLIIIVVFLNIRDSNKNAAKQSSICEKDRRKTNANLEQKILDTYMKHGFSFDDAFRKSYEDIIAAGYDPCIPREAYKSKRDNSVQTSFCSYRGFFNPEGYDSYWVQARRKEAREEWQASHPEKHINYATPEELQEIEAMTYKNFPTTETAFLRDVKRSTMRLKAEPIGSFIIYPGLGTCEVIAHKWIGDGTAGGTYTLKVLKTGQIVTYVRIGDSKIRRQG